MGSFIKKQKGRDPLNKLMRKNKFAMKYDPLYRKMHEDPLAKQRQALATGPAQALAAMPDVGQMAPGAPQQMPAMMPMPYDPYMVPGPRVGYPYKQEN